MNIKGELRFIGVFVVLVAISTWLAGCSTLGDGAIATLPVPDAATDCQHRSTTLSVRALPWSPVTATTHITTVIGADKCPKGLAVVVPTLQRLDTGNENNETAELRRVVEALRRDLDAALREAQ